MSRLLGGFRTRLPAYASTYHGDRRGGLDSMEKYADFAEECYALGYRVSPDGTFPTPEGMRSPAEVASAATRMSATLPPTLWERLRHAGILADGVPNP